MADNFHLPDTKPSAFERFGLYYLCFFRKKDLTHTVFDFTDDGNYKVKGGPSTRRVIDFSDIENSMSILPTGQSGNPFSKHYNDQAELYNAGKFRKMKMNKAEIIRTSTKLVFKPK